MKRRVRTTVPRGVPGGQLRRTLLSVRRFRMNFLFGTLTVLFALLLGRLAILQLIDGPSYRAEAERKHNSAYRFQPRRGRLLDRNGVPLAVPKPARSVGIDPTQIRDLRTFSIVLSDFLGGEPRAWRIEEVVNEAREQAERTRRPLSQYRVLIPYTDEPASVDRIDELARISIRRKRHLGLYGVVVHATEGRRYPNGTYGAHVLGQMPRADGGKGTGAEQAFNADLAGIACRVPVYRDGRRRPYARSGAVNHASTRGLDVRLTIDVTIQHYLESALDELIAQWNPGQVSGIVLDPHSGAVLALSNRPTFDPNLEPANMNFAIQGLYEPGSFFKPFTVSWALAHGVVTEDEVLQMPSSVLFPHEVDVINDSHYVGPGTIRRLIAQSSNTGAAELADRLGCARMRALFERTYPDRTGGTRCGLPYEKSAGPRKAKWPWWLAHRAAYGNGFHVTPMQMITSFAAFARDDARIVQPRIRLDDERSGAGGLAVCRAEHLPVIRESLELCASEGTSSKAFAGAPFRAAAKTATAQQWGRMLGERFLYANCTVAAYAPAKRPQVVVLILAQIPDSAGGFGGSVAGPHVRTVIERVLAYWNVRPGTRPSRVLAAAEGGER